MAQRRASRWAAIALLGIPLLGIALLPFVAMRAGAQTSAEVEVVTHALGDGLYMLVGRGGNIGLSVGPDGTFLIDDQYAPLIPKIRSAISAVGSLPVRFVFNTHWHGDHTGGNESFGKAGALIVAHDHARARMSTPQFMKAFDREVPASPPDALPVVTFGEDLTFHLNGHEIHAVHVAAAHTDGDAIVHFRDANLIHMGDTFFSGLYPFIDLSSGGSIEGVISAIRSGLKLCDDATRVIPGHGPLSSRAELKASLDMLVAVRERVRAAIAEGQGRDQIVASGLTADLDPVWGGGFMKPPVFVGIVYESLANADGGR